jgi:glutathione S-transferase
MNQATADKIHYVRIPKAHGGRAEMVRLVYVLAGKPYTDVLWTFEQAQSAGKKNPFRQFPVVETPTGAHIYQTLAIMHHAARETPAWPSDPQRLTDALAVAMSGYDLYQWFGSFAADDLAAKKKFEERRAPQFMAGLARSTPATLRGRRAPTFADCIVEEAVACVRRNDASRKLYEANAALVAFHQRFDAIPAVRVSARDRPRRKSRRQRVEPP